MDLLNYFFIKDNLVLQYMKASLASTACLTPGTPLPTTLEANLPFPPSTLIFSINLYKRSTANLVTT